MKVLFIITNLNAGGAERVLALVANYISKFHKVTILKFDKEASFYKLSKNITLINFDFKKTAKYSPFRICKKIFYQTKVMQNHDIIISFLNTTNILAIISNLMAKKPLIISEHTSFYKDKKSFLNLLMRIFYPKADALSVLTKEDFDEFSFVKNKFIIQNPIFKLPKIELSKENTILFVGRLTEVKGCDRFLKALSLVDKELLSRFEILILGDGELKNELKKLACSLSLDVKFLGNIQNIAEIYAKSKIIVSTSLVEGLPNVLIEAIFFEIARVATKTRGAKELIEDGVDGLLCGDISEVARSIEVLLKDESLRLNLVKNANLKKDKFKIENIINEWENLIQKVVKK